MSQLLYSRYKVDLLSRLKDVNTDETQSGSRRRLSANTATNVESIYPNEFIDMLVEDNVKKPSLEVRHC